MKEWLCEGHQSHQSGGRLVSKVAFRLDFFPLLSQLTYWTATWLLMIIVMIMVIITDDGDQSVQGANLNEFTLSALNLSRWKI